MKYEQDSYKHYIPNGMKKFGRIEYENLSIVPLGTQCL